MTSLSIIGYGAFGRLAHHHLENHFDILIHDPKAEYDTPLSEVAKSDIILICTPVRTIENIAQNLAPLLQAGQLVMDVASVKTLPAQWMEKHLPVNVDIVATHPIFGPESGKNGIEGLPISLMNVRGNRLADVENFCQNTLHLRTIITTPADHDQEMAYVQGLTHLIAKILKRMDVPELQQTTKTYNHLLAMVDMIKNDSPELFQSIQTDNPFVRDVTDAFFEQAKQLKDNLTTEGTDNMG